MICYMNIIAKSPVVSHKTITLSGNGKEKIRVLHLSDIHISNFQPRISFLHDAIQKQKPDIILISGDYIEKPKDANKIAAFLYNVIPEDVPCYGCLGNHDIEAFMDKEQNMDGEGLDQFKKHLNMTPMKLLDNDHAIFTKNAAKLQILGMGDIRYSLHDIEKMYQDSSPGVCNIVIAHNPDSIYELKNCKADYVLTGHFHGGQIWLPFHLEYKLLRKERLCRLNITRGHHIVNNKKLFINRGLGCVVVPLRFCSSPEIACLDFIL